MYLEHTLFLLLPPRRRPPVRPWRNHAHHDGRPAGRRVLHVNRRLAYPVKPGRDVTAQVILDRVPVDDDQYRFAFHEAQDDASREEVERKGGDSFNDKNYEVPLREVPT